MKLSRVLLLCSLFVLLAALTACGPSNTVRLLQVKPDKTVLPAPSATSVTVVKFEDRRPDTTNLGLRRDKSSFITNDNVQEWVSRAAADALTAKGFQVTYAATTAEAIKGHPDYLLTGSIRDVNIAEDSISSFTTNITVKYTLANRSKKVLTETLNSSQKHTGIPSSSATEECLSQTLADIVTPMATKIAAQAGK